MVVNLGFLDWNVGQKSHIDDGFKCGVLNWLCNQDESFYATGIIILQGQ
jgi:hypothetical protein